MFWPDIQYSMYDWCSINPMSFCFRQCSTTGIPETDNILSVDDAYKRSVAAALKQVLRVSLHSLLCDRWRMTDSVYPVTVNWF